jgi:uncharacterized phage protein (predicted DNA packaging)
MMTLAEMKSYLKVDYNDDDNEIALMMNVAREYIIDAIGECDETIARVQLLMRVIVGELYEKRSMTFDMNSTNQKVQYVIRSIINQLSFGDDDSEDDS